MFILGMAVGGMAGTAFGIGMMCCMIAGKREDQQMERREIQVYPLETAEKKKR